MKKLIISLCLLPVLTAGASADSFEDFKTQIALQGEALLKPFAMDLGGVIGANDFNSGRTLGFPGFEVGLAATVQAKPSDENRVLRDADVNAFGVPMVHAGVALPAVGADVMARAVSLSGFSIVGGGLRKSIIKSGTLTKFIPDVSVSAWYDVINYDYFKGSHLSFDATASFDIPVIKPYVGVGVDRTTLEIKNVNAALNGVDATISKPRYTVGVRLSPLPLLYVYGAYNILHGQAGYSLGAGAKF
ncbi:MAG TPA: hypothetical protein DCW72_08670 [Elusimicrobia bacterium]|nr:MAG: hypothetical protein A2X29_07920 [Elusimicrobia bacterium GWA2_64_40]OGR66340.1 MAG: hypothetical protein A2X30_10470 [Elusimicrobia bacterium GWB2_63_16]HAN03737.1 hypothetical protein [Elusimicrobiota bacterium]HAU90269.1 hypothetical protein [Elusimicrobiota bacterium]